MKHYPNYCCDVCGPGGAHIYHLAFTAIEAFLVFRGRDPAEGHNLEDLARLAKDPRNGIEELVDLISALLSKDLTYKAVPAQSDVDEVLRLADQLVYQLPGINSSGRG